MLLFCLVDYTGKYLSFDIHPLAKFIHHMLPCSFGIDQIESIEFTGSLLL